MFALVPHSPISQKIQTMGWSNVIVFHKEMQQEQRKETFADTGINVRISLAVHTSHQVA